MKTILPNCSPRVIAAKPSRASVSGIRAWISGRAPVCSQKWSSRPSFAPCAHGGADDGQLQEKEPLQIGRRGLAAGRAGNHDPAAGLE